MQIEYTLSVAIKESKRNERIDHSVVIENEQRVGNNVRQKSDNRRTRTESSVSAETLIATLRPYHFLLSVTPSPHS